MNEHDPLLRIEYQFPPSGRHPAQLLSTSVMIDQFERDPFESSWEVPGHTLRDDDEWRRQRLQRQGDLVAFLGPKAAAASICLGLLRHYVAKGTNQRRSGV